MPRKPCRPIMFFVVVIVVRLKLLLLEILLSVAITVSWVYSYIDQDMEWAVFLQTTYTGN